METYLTIPAKVEHICKLLPSNSMPEHVPGKWVGMCVLCVKGAGEGVCLSSLKDVQEGL